MMLIHLDAVNLDTFSKNWVASVWKKVMVFCFCIEIEEQYSIKWVLMKRWSGEMMCRFWYCLGLWALPCRFRKSFGWGRKWFTFYASWLCICLLLWKAHNIRPCIHPNAQRSHDRRDLCHTKQMWVGKLIGLWKQQHWISVFFEF